MHFLITVSSKDSTWISRQYEPQILTIFYSARPWKLRKGNILAKDNECLQDVWKHILSLGGIF